MEYWKELGRHKRESPRRLGHTLIPHRLADSFVIDSRNFFHRSATMAPGPRPTMASVSKAEMEADVVMGVCTVLSTVSALYGRNTRADTPQTNNSSIASKRSVEMIYYPQPHFFRYFVKKPQRRSPIINRGYWLRMHAMAETVRQFMEKAPVDKPKFVLNLGCG